MLESLQRAAHRKGIAAFLAAVVAVAGVGVAVANPGGGPAPTGVSSTVATVSPPGLESFAGGTGSSPGPEVPPPMGAPGEMVTGETTTTSPAAATVAPDVRAPAPEQFLPEGGGFGAGDLEGLLAGGFSPDVAAGAEELASGVMARIEACVGDLFSDFDFHFDSDADFGPGGDFGSGFEEGAARAGAIVEDVLACVGGLVDDALSCVNGLVEEILAVAMGMDLDEIAGLIEVIVAELVACVGDASG
ncbi:MAG TPA: hypothetical protein VNT56_02415 [Acidimicrobiales bacterium]|nr:hypothetical protein [Acidimicrobiales bacterium]